MRKSKRDVTRHARKALRKYIKSVKAPQSDRREDYLITDLIADLMHLAEDRGFDAEMVVHAAQNHFEVEH